MRSCRSRSRAVPLCSGRVSAAASGRTLGGPCQWHCTDQLVVGVPAAAVAQPWQKVFGGGPLATAAAARQLGSWRAEAAAHSQLAFL
jgi:hypothetical protein